MLKFLDFSHFVILQLLKRIWAKSVRPAQNGSNFKIVPPNFSFINSKDFHKIKDFSKNSNPHRFLVLEDIKWIFSTVTYDNDLIQWCNFCKDWKGVSPVLGCGSLRSPQESITSQYPRTDRVKLKISNSHTPKHICIIMAPKVLTLVIYYSVQGSLMKALSMSYWFMLVL